ncbi:hypothetical protein BH10ACI2_BH10ACI2_15930 [soil metagenome]
MKETSIEKRASAPLKERGQYAIAFSVIAVMLYVAGFPVFLLFFVGALAFFIWKVFSTESRHESRKIFEFYLSANEILRDDDRRWYGFEIQETIARGESIVRSMSAAPPLTHFALGALYQKMDDHSSAVKHLTNVVDENSTDELSFVYPNRDLREYVRMLRKIERSPADAPLTSSAIRSLERSRKNRGKEMLEASRLHLSKAVVPTLPSEKRLESVVDIAQYRDTENSLDNGSASQQEAQGAQDGPLPFFVADNRKAASRSNSERQNVDRKTISEVLHDIYDTNVQ